MQKKILRFILLFVVFSIVFLFLMKLKTESMVNSAIAEIEFEKTLPEDFYAFYDQFHTDSLFQMERIVFPLKGLAKSADTTKIAEEVLWQKSNWKLHKPFNDHGGTFERGFTHVNNIVSEQISAQNGLFTLEKRYAKLSTGWHLIYYQELIMRG